MQRGGVAAVLLLSLCAGTFVLPHTDHFDDAACSPIFVNHDESAHYIGAARPPSNADGQHCLLCHSFRSFYPGFEKSIQRDGLIRAEHLHLARVVFAEDLDWSLVPGRAPPA